MSRLRARRGAEREVPALELISRGASLLVIGIGLLGMAGWAFEFRVLKSVLPGLPVMLPATAACLGLAGVSLWSVHPGTALGTSPLVARFCAVGVAFLGSVALLQHLVGHEGRIDSPSFLTAVNCLLLGVALVLVAGPTLRSQRIAEIFTVTALLVALLALIGFICKVPSFYQWKSVAPSSGLSLHTVVGFIALSVGLICARPEGGLIRTITSATSGGVMARRLLLAPVAIPLLSGLVGLACRRAGVLNLELTSWLFAFLNIFVFTVVLWWSAESLRRAENARDHVETELQRFFNLSLDMVCIAGFDGYFKRLNPAFTQTLGFTTDELLQQPFIEFVHPDDRAATLAEVQKLTLGEPTLAFENRYRCQDGSWRWLSWRARPVPSEGLLYATAHDITNRKMAEAAIQQLNSELHHRASQLETANSELESFSYSISHDLRAPLRHVQGYAEMLASATAGQLSDEAKRCLKTISDASVEMGQLIDDLLAFSRMGRVQLRETAVSLEGLVQDAIKGLEMSTRGRDVIWKIAPLPPVCGDPPLLKQVLTNLIGNALKYSRDRHPAEIEIFSPGEEDGRTIYGVRDNGVGFDMRYAGKLFGVFQRLHRADEFEGTGIGLALVRRIIARHGGRTWAEATPGNGASFYFTLQSAASFQTQP